MMALLAGVALAVTLAGGPVHGPVRTEWLPCGVEDDVNCVWDADHRGNGQGQSLFVGREGVAHPIPHHMAHALLYRTTRKYRICPVPVTSDPVLCFWAERLWHNREGDTREVPRSVARYLLSR